MRKIEMTISIELLLFLLAFAVSCGVVKAELKAIRKDIKRLEVKQDKYNNLQERTHDLEMWKQYHEQKHSSEDK